MVVEAGVDSLVLVSWRCENCWRLSKPRCWECCLPIVDKVTGLTVNWSSASNPSLQMLTALDRSYHPACFVCSKCSKMLEGTEFLVTGEEVKSVTCRECYVK